MGKHAVHHRAHGVLADAVVHVTARAVFGSEGNHLWSTLGRRLQVGSATDQLGNGPRQHSRYLAGLELVVGCSSRVSAAWRL